ncbi:MAG: hypothetical protein R3B99_32020 [Polyangiales bacterium]
MSNRTLAVDAKLLEELQLTRAQLGLSGTPCLSQDDVDRLHEELEVTLSDDVLAIFAMLEKDLRQAVVLTEELREEGLPSSYVALLSDPEKLTWCLRKGKGTLTAWPAKTNLPKTLDAIVRRFRMLDAVEQQDDDDEEPQLDEGFDDDLDLGDEDEERDGESESDGEGEDGEEGDEAREEREIAKDLAARVKPKPVKRPPPKAKKKPTKPKREPRPVEDVTPWIVVAEKKERWVAHPRFGKGRVVREVKDGRHFLEIAFEDGTTRKLLAEFVKDA